ncbi:fluoride efflux transporter FluC [Ligilactobacillus apodemi]|uniref:Fluoride-specific ion channel FluC n=1 Tax=Ligilactobacillus apodemi DSM 16634 = JCM 16172 TaxID=1423724 RepID=A0A0R1TQC3_9LACO|nr:CrcB family protein [Ligilactobacillus apodemi]KRL83649.1 hypothetical protein FC32_GL000909 [Ligilactobacillus apodemi DSM 16634 = JCM 16172]
MKKSTELLLVGCGCFFGGTLRYVCETLIGLSVSEAFAILVVNVSGCFLIGLISAGLFKKTLSAEFGKLASTGFCGGLTTFSSFADVADGIVNLFDASQVVVGLLYIALNMLLGLLAVYLGLKVVLKTKFSDFAN